MNNPEVKHIMYDKCNHKGVCHFRKKDGTCNLLAKQEEPLDPKCSFFKTTAQVENLFGEEDWNLWEHLR